MAVDVLPQLSRRVAARRLVRVRVNRRRFLMLAGAGAAGGRRPLHLADRAALARDRAAADCRSARLPPALAGRTLVQISDIHVGTRVADDYVIRDVPARRGAAARYRGGDRRLHQPPRRIARQVARDLSGTFRRAASPRVAVLGNHDYGADWAHPEVARQVVDIVQSLGITVLRNEVREVEGLQIAGLDDLWADQFRPAQALRRLDPRRAALVLSHNPDTVGPAGVGRLRGMDPVRAHPRRPVQAAVPAAAAPAGAQPALHGGRVGLAGGRRLYISRGVGHLLQVRFNVRPEVTAFELRPA